MGRDEEFKNSAQKADADLLKQKKDDHNNEMAGRETGRQERFRFKDQRLLNETRKKQQEHTLKQLLLINSIYAALYNETLQNLRDAENAVYDAQLQSANLVSEAQKALDQILTNASTTTDGRAVFRSADGSVYTQDGALLEGDDLIGINWHEDASSWEEYQAQLSNLHEAQKNHNRMNSHAERLAAFRTEMEDKDNPPSEERLNEINNESEIIYNDTRKNNDIQSEFAVQKVEFSPLPDLGL